MPCYNGDPTNEEIRLSNEAIKADNEQRQRCEAALCAVLTYLLDRQTMNEISWNEAGISKQLILEWWETHLSKELEQLLSTINYQKRNNETVLEQQRQRVKRLTKSLSSLQDKV